ncbi:MAG: RNA methyltransferase [Candidatus Aminicenantes bacterium]|nr:RNA methyltransferase [Candidatus Aminicenantes bacterium]
MVIKGINPIIEALKSGAEVEKIILPAGRKDPRIEEIKKLARELSVPFSFSPSEKSPVAQVSPVRLLEEDEVLKYRTIICLDRVEDPMNFGAIIRSAYAFEAAIVSEKRHSSALTDTVARASAGAMFKAAIHRTSNLKAFLKRAKEAGYWVICAQKTGIPLNEFKFPEKRIIILGSEGKGIRKSVSGECDFELSIPMKGEIDSLNVSVAAGIFLFFASSK